VLRAEAPAHHEALCAVLAALPIELVIDGESLELLVSDGAIAVGPVIESPLVTVTTSLRTARALLEARRTMVAAIERGELDVRGHADALDDAAEALSLFLHGLVRAPSSPPLLDDLRHHVDCMGVHHGE
jgi:hypothetical protein